MLPCCESTAAKAWRDANGGDADELVMSQSHAVALIARAPASARIRAVFLAINGRQSAAVARRQATSWQPAAAEEA